MVICHIILHKIPHFQVKWSNLVNVRYKRIISKILACLYGEKGLRQSPKSLLMGFYLENFFTV